MTNDTDGHLGQRLRQRRWMLGLTQTQVGDRVGIKFQQIQKYETGQNRISAARLWDLAVALDVPISYFYEGLGGDGAPPADTRKDARAAATALATRGPAAAAAAVQGDPMTDRETIELARAFMGLPASARAKLVEFLRALVTDRKIERPSPAAALTRPAPKAADARRHAS